jgi:hypothetical protein
MTGLTKLDGYGITVGSQYADKFKGLLDDLEANGIKVDRSQSGGYNYRNIAGTNRLSNHAYGRALDVNWTDNARGTKGKIDPTLARTLAQKHGLVWGGDWSNPDPMHFEVAGALNAAGGQHNHSHGSTASSPGTPGQSTPNAGAAPMAYSGATPDSVAQARKMAQALMSQGMSGQPVQHWTQALGRVLQAGVGSMWDSQAAQGEKEGTAAAQQAMAAALAGGDPNAHVTALMANPWTKDQGTQLAQAMLKNKLAPDAPPASIQEHKYVQSLPEAQRDEFFKVKRQERFLDLGTHYQDPRTGQVYPKDNITPARDKAMGAEQGTSQAKAQFNLPQVESAAARMLKQIEELETDTSLDSITGLVGGRIAEKYHTEGMSRAQSRINQIAGGTFLQAYNELRGGGAITEEEGKQAKASYTRLANQTMGTPDYRKALAEAREETLKLVELAKRKAAGGAASAPAAPGGPQPGTVMGGYRFKGGDPGKQENWEPAQ